jgi:AcrR family transcriptional regulator
VETGTHEADVLVAPTGLYRALQEGSGPDASTAFRAARQTFLAGQRIDMQELADSLGIGRSTLHRWVGSRDVLLSEIIWSLVEARFRRALGGSSREGPARVVDALVASVLGSQVDGFFQAFVRREPQRALRLCTTKGSPVQQRVVAMLCGALVESAKETDFTHPLPLERVAYLLLRIGESFFYADLITGQIPDTTELEIALNLVLGLPVTWAASRTRRGAKK